MLHRRYWAGRADSLALTLPFHLVLLDLLGFFTTALLSSSDTFAAVSKVLLIF
jgi:hypothetical protein